VSDEVSTVAESGEQSNGAEVSEGEASCESVVDLSMSRFFLDRPSSGEDFRVIVGVVGSRGVCEGRISW